MNKLSVLLMMVLVSSCSGIKVMKGGQPTPTPKPGVTMSSNWMSGGGLDKGYWCDVRANGLITVGQSGPTEAKATELAQEKCHSIYKDSKCELIGCSHNGNKK